jgi:hypothetical protein
MYAYPAQLHSEEHQNANQRVMYPLAKFQSSDRNWLWRDDNQITCPAFYPQHHEEKKEKERKEKIRDLVL